jgi:hypothetical protein
MGLTGEGSLATVVAPILVWGQFSDGRHGQEVFRGVELPFAALERKQVEREAHARDWGRVGRKGHQRLLEEKEGAGAVMRSD